MKNQFTKLACFCRVWLSEVDPSERDRGAVTEETAMRVILVGAAIAAATAIGVIIATNVSSIPKP